MDIEYVYVLKWYNHTDKFCTSYAKVIIKKSRRSSYVFRDIINCLNITGVDNSILLKFIV
jgi:hypothetical protein